MQSLAGLAICLLLAAPLLAGGDELFTVSPADGFLRVVDPLSGSTLRSTQIVTSTGPVVSGCNGLAVHPATGQLWALVRTIGSTRRLATIDPVTAVATVIGATADSFAGIAFRSDGVLFGVTGDGAVVPETLYQLDLNTAAATLVAALGNGNDGEAIAFDPLDGFLYHASGLGLPNVDEVFERVDPATGATAAVALAGFDYDEMLGMTCWVGGNLLGADLNGNLVVVNTSGHVRRLGVLDHNAKGLAFLPAANTTAFLRAYGTGCTTSTGEVPLLWGTGSPGPGQGFSIELRLAPTSSFGLLAAGVGQGTLPFPSPQCAVQIAPIGATISFFTSVNGDASFPFAVPAWLSPGDFYFQAGLLDGTSFAVSNPLQTHLH